MTLTDDQLTDAITSRAAAPAPAPAWNEVVSVGSRQRRSRIGTTTIAGLVAVGSLLAVVFSWGSDSAPLETAAPEHEIVAMTERATARSVDPVELSGTEWTIAGDWNGDDESLGAVIRFVDGDGPSQRLVVELNCNPTIYELEWDGWAFTSREVPLGTALLCADPDRDVDAFWRSAATFVARFSDDELVIERNEEELRLRQTAFGRPNRPGAAVQEDVLLDPELIFGEWRIIDLGPGGGLIDQAGRADDIRITLTQNEVVVQHSCRSFAFDAEWTAGSLWTRRRAQEPVLAIGCEAHPGFVNLVEFLDRSGWMAALLVDGQLELARSPGTERIRAMGTSTR